MNKIWTIARKDFRSYFSSPVAYIVMCGFLLLMGWFFYFNLVDFINRGLQFQRYSMGNGPSLTQGIIQPTFGNMNVILLFLVPFITMRMFAEEKKLNTIQLLMTSPLSLMEIIGGKFLGALLFVSVMIGATMLFPIFLIFVGNPDIGPIFTGFLGSILLASSYIAVGMFFSAMTENQIVAGALAFAGALFFWLISWATQAAGPTWSGLLYYLSLITHFRDFSQGILNTADLVYYISFIGLGLFLTHRVLDSYRWRS